LRNSPLYSVLGNHEQESPYYYNYFPVQKQKPWWSADYGSVHIVGLDTSVPTDSNSEQYQFLLEDLKKNKKPWTIVVFHYPIFHSHPYRPIQEFRHEWQSLFMEYDVDLVLTGHDHYYQRTFPIGRMTEKQQGVVHITTAGGGAMLYPTISQPYSAYDRSLYHYLLIDVTEDELEIRAIDEDNHTFDAIILNKYQDHSAANFVEYGMFELEEGINDILGGLAPGENKKGIVSFDTTLSVETDFYMQVSGKYQWQSTDSWKFDQSSHEFTVSPGEKLQIRLKAQVNKKDFMPTPELFLHLEADNSSRNISEHRPYQKSLGFRNQDLQFSIEEAAFKSAISNTTENLTPLFSFLKYYGNSQYAQDMLLTLGNRILNNRDKSILPNLKAFLKNNPSDLNKYRIYPFYFLFEDFKNLEEWMDIIGRLPEEQLSFAPKLICQLAELDIFNSRMIESWNLIGPFDAPDWQGFTTDYGPEIKFDLEKEYDSRAGSIISWNKYSALDYKIDLIDALAVPAHASSNLVAYAHTELEAVKEGEILLLLGSDDDPVVWVNGIEVHRKQVGRGLKPCQDILVVPVKAGKNDILIKVVQRGGAWSLDLRVSDWKSILTWP